MSRHALTFRYVDVLPMIGFGSRREVWKLLERAALTVTGYFRRRPDPRLENALRAAFADIDRGLAEILGDRRPDRH
ncbi:MAG TPA: hypothetical protein VGG83_16480 [Trebonia sp.]|jgi:hypothetical protein